jgi:hypothetical protein
MSYVLYILEILEESYPSNAESCVTRRDPNAEGKTEARAVTQQNPGGITNRTLITIWRGPRLPEKS